MRAVGVVIHPTRDVSRSIDLLRAWVGESGVRVGQLMVGEATREVVRPIDIDEVDLVLAIGGDGTTLAAIRAASQAALPVLGVACGSLGVLSRTTEQELPQALDRFARGEHIDRLLPALQLSAGGEPFRAFNDFSVVRRGDGQIRVTAIVDGELYARVAGDGVIIATPLGSSGYSLSAGGPLLPLELPGFLMTPLPSHGGTHPPLVLTQAQTLELRIDGAYGGARLEVDGRAWNADSEHPVTVSLVPDAFRAVLFEDSETLLTGLRRRGIVADSPRVLAEDAHLRGRY